jgi:small acid-soluble spore protein (thioredoxin-like protein)
MKNNPDDRRDNARKIKQNIDGTLRNMEAAEEAIAGSSDPKMKKALEEKNERRKQALHGRRSEIRDAAQPRQGNS